MGTLYWQLNDCWPVVSWSSIDYFGRWKAVQYTVKEAYKPVLFAISIEKEKIIVNAVSDYLVKNEGELRVQIINLSGDTIKSWHQKLTIKPNLSEQIFTSPFNYSNADSSNIFTYTEFRSSGGDIFNSYTFNCKPDNLNLKNPDISVKVEKKEDGSYIILLSKYPAFYVQITSPSQDFKVDNNYFNMFPNEEYRVKVIKGNVDGIEVKSLFDYIK